MTSTSNFETRRIEAARNLRREMAAAAWRRLRGRPGQPSSRRGNPLSRYSDEDVLAVNHALTRLESMDPRSVALVELRFFGNLDLAEAAEVLECPYQQVVDEWTVARAWLRRELGVESAATLESSNTPADPSPAEKDGGGSG